MALVRLDRVWVAQLVGGLRVGSGSSCAVWLGLAWLPAARLYFEWPLAQAHPLLMVCVLAKQQLCDVRFFPPFWLSEIPCTTDMLVCTLGGAHALLRISIGAGTRCRFLLLWAGGAVWHLFPGQCGFDATVPRKRLDGKHGFFIFRLRAAFSR